MRKLQITILVLAVGALIGAACCMGHNVGTELRRAGTAALLVDVVLIQLWPPKK